MECIINELELFTLGITSNLNKNIAIKGTGDFQKQINFIKKK